MTILRRITRLFKADVHGILDCLEEPQALLKQAIRDMEAEIESSQSATNSLETALNRDKKRQKEVEIVIAELDQQMDFCFESAREDLARKFIRKKLETQRIRSELEKNLSKTREELKARHEKLKEQRQRLEQIQQKAEVFMQSPDHCAGNESIAPWSPSDDEVEVAFLQEKQRRIAKAS